MTTLYTAITIYMGVGFLLGVVTLTLNSADALAPWEKLFYVVLLTFVWPIFFTVAYMELRKDRRTEWEDSYYG
jgi:Na+/H+-dicarboxylate symporter